MELVWMGAMGYKGFNNFEKKDWDKEIPIMNIFACESVKTISLWWKLLWITTDTLLSGLG